MATQPEIFFAPEIAYVCNWLTLSTTQKCFYFSVPRPSSETWNFSSLVIPRFTQSDRRLVL